MQYSTYSYKTLYTYWRGVLILIVMSSRAWRIFSKRMMSYVLGFLKGTSSGSPHTSRESGLARISLYGTTTGRSRPRASPKHIHTSEPWARLYRKRKRFNVIFILTVFLIEQLFDLFPQYDFFTHAIDVFLFCCIITKTGFFFRGGQTCDVTNVRFYLWRHEMKM